MSISSFPFLGGDFHLAWYPAPIRGSGAQFVFASLVPQFAFTGPGPNFVFIGPGINFLLPVWGLSLYIVTLFPNVYLLAMAYDLCCRFGA